MKKIRILHKTCRCSVKDTDPVVKPGLAITPAQMRALNAQGIPVSTGNANHLYETGHEKLSWDIAPDNRRGVDPAELWQIEQSARKKLKYYQPKSK